MHSIVAWSESIDEAGVFANIAAVPDQSIKTSGDYVYVGNYNILIGGMACIGTTGVSARLSSPSLRRINPHYIAPIELDIYPNGIIHHGVNPALGYPLDINEGLEAEVEANPAAAEQHTVVAWLADQRVQPVQG